MKRLFTMAVALVVASFSYAQSCNAPAASGSGSGGSGFSPSQTVRANRSTANSQVRPENLSELTAAELDFKANGPKLFTMAEAEAISARTGKVIVCWVSTPETRVFSLAAAREKSKELGDTTIQAIMTDTSRDGLTAKGPRVQFSDKNYKSDATTKFIPVSKFDKDTSSKILAFARGAK